MRLFVLLTLLFAIHGTVMAGDIILAGRADTAENCTIAQHEFGCAMKNQGEGWALQRVNITAGSATFAVRYKTLNNGGGNAFIAFGESGENANLVKCGTFMGAGFHSIFQGVKNDYVKGAKKEFTGEKNQVFDAMVTVDLNDRRIIMKTKDGELTWGLPENIGAIKYAGIWGWNMNAVFSWKIEPTNAPASPVSAAAPKKPSELAISSAASVQKNTEAAGGTETVIYARPDGRELTLAVDKAKGDGPFPVIVWIHGGGWTGGNEAQFKMFSMNLTYLGIEGVRINYRKVPEGGTFEKTMTDVMTSIQWVRDNAAKYKFDMTRFGLAGGSAGGHLSAIAAQRTPECIAYVGFNGGYDLFTRGKSGWPSESLLNTFIGGRSEAALKNASAIWQIRKPPPDTLLIHGTADTTIDPDVAVRFAAAIISNGGAAKISLYEGMTHGFFNGTKFTETYIEAEKHFCRVFGIAVK